MAVNTAGEAIPEADKLQIEDYRAIKEQAAAQSKLNSSDRAILLSYIAGYNKRIEREEKRHTQRAQACKRNCNPEPAATVTPKQKEWSTALIHIFDVLSTLNLDGLERIRENLNELLQDGQYSKNITDISWYQNRSN